MEINFVTGKGGVGKSAVAAALAIKLSKAGMRTLLVELGDQSYYQDYFSLPRVSYEPTPWQVGGVWASVAQWGGQECLKEYALHILKIQSLYRLFFENPVSKALVNVAPGLPELSILGKITSGPPRNVGPKLPFDAIVVDAYASGHFMSLLRAPSGLSAAIRFGPMGEQVRDIDAIIRDSRICKYHVVALPEELPVVEGIELAQNIEKQTGVVPQLIMNRMMPVQAEQCRTQNESLKPFARYLLEVDERQKSMFTRLQHAGFPLQSLPWVFSTDPNATIAELSDALAEVLA